MTFTPTTDPHRTTREVEKSIYNQLVEYNTYPMYYIVVSYTTRGKSDIEKYNYSNICLSGGVSLNCVMAGKLYEWFPEIKSIYAEKQ